MKSRILILIFLVLAAFSLPVLVWSAYDQKIEAEDHRLEVSISMYTASEEERSLEERLGMIARQLESGARPAALQLNTPQEYSGEELCTLAKRELDLLADIGLPLLSHSLEFFPEDITFCRTYNYIAGYASKLLHIRWDHSAESEDVFYYADMIVDCATEKLLYMRYSRKYIDALSYSSDKNIAADVEIALTEETILDWSEKWGSYLGISFHKETDAATESAVSATQEKLQQQYVSVDTDKHKIIEIPPFYASFPVNGSSLDICLTVTNQSFGNFTSPNEEWVAIGFQIFEGLIE